MDPVIGGALISAGSKLVGDLLGGSDGPDHLSKRTYQANYNSITGKVDAAKAMGISPLYALGAPTMSPGGMEVGGGGGSLGETISSMGGDISRAVAAQQTDEERALQKLILDKARLENEFLGAQIASVRQRTIRESAPPRPNVPGRSFDTPEFSPAQVTPDYTFMGIPVRSNPYQDDSQTVTNRLGDSEIMEMINAVGTGTMDAYWTLMGALTGDPYYRKGNRLDVR